MSLFDTETQSPPAGPVVGRPAHHRPVTMAAAWANNADGNRAVDPSELPRATEPATRAKPSAADCNRR